MSWVTYLGTHCHRLLSREQVVTVTLVCVLAIVAVAVHARVLAYPFIQDDWVYINEVLNSDPFQLLVDVFSPFGKDFYRPLGILYFVLVTKMFGLNPILSHTTALILHIASSLMVVAVLTRLTRDSRVGWLAGVLYASASFVHMDSLLWASGIFENASVLLVLLAIWFFLQGDLWPCAVAYAVALLFKESVAFLPLLLVTIALVEGAPKSQAQAMDKWSIRRWAPICLVMALYGFIKLAGNSAAVFPQDHPYALRITGAHVLTNALTYAKWSVQALFPLDHSISPVGAIYILASLTLVLVSGLLIGPRKGRWFHDASPGAISLFVWLLASMSIYFFLPNHVYVYYMTVGLPALLGLFLLSLKVGCDLIRIPASVSAALLTLLTAASVISSYMYFQQIDRHGLNQPYTEGTNDLVRRGATVAAVHDSLSTAHPTFPRGAILLFKGVVLWAFGQHAGPRVWYRDPSIRAYDAKDLVEESGRWFLQNPLEDQVEAYTGAAPRRISLDCCPVFFFELTDRGLVEHPLESIKRSIDVAGYGLMDTDTSAAMERYRLEASEDGRTVVLHGPQGNKISIIPGVVEGHLDLFTMSDRDIDVAGWAASTKSLPAQMILLFLDGKNVLTLPPGAERPDLVKAFGNKELYRAGFRYRIPRTMLTLTSTTASLRFFAISHDARVASELGYPGNYPFQHR